MLKWSAFSTLGLAVAAGATGAALGALSGTKQDEANDLSVPYVEAKKLHDTAKGYATGANVLFAAAGASALASGVLFYFAFRKDSSPQKEAPLSAAVVPTASGFLVQLGEVTW